MRINTALIAELKHESINTRRILERVPSDKFDWAPHEKSMKIGELASHIAGLTVWVERIMKADEFNFGTANFSSTAPATLEDILNKFDTKLAEAIKVLELSPDESFNEMWTVKYGEQVLYQLPKKVAVRNFTFNHTYHHRGQLTVYLRLLDIAVPGMYGPSADEKM